VSLNTFETRSELKLGETSYNFFDLNKLDQNKIAGYPVSIKILIENLLRHEDNRHVTRNMIESLINWGQKDPNSFEISFFPERVLMQDLTGIPGVVDLASMREAVVELKGDPSKVNPKVPVELVIDHSVIADYSGSGDSFKKNVDLEYERNIERYQLLKWAQSAFTNLKIVPPGTGICHQVNLEYLARVVFKGDSNTVYFDTLVGTDSHTTMVNSLGVLGWGVGGIEAEAAMLSQPISMLAPQVLGVKLIGALPTAVTSTDLVLHICEILRKYNVVGKFVEFFGPSLSKLAVETRATISNMSPEYGATCVLFPVDEKTLEYLEFTARSKDQIDLVEKYSRAQGVFHEDAATHELAYSDILEISLNDIEPCIAGPSRPQDKIALRNAKDKLTSYIKEKKGEIRPGPKLTDGDVVIAAITSCTNTSNPYVMIAAGLLAKKAVERGLVAKPWVKTTLAPGSRVVKDYLEASGLLNYLEKLGFYLVGFGCTTCIGNSGPLLDDYSEIIKTENLLVASVLSGNRNFEGRIHPDVKMNFLASPPLVVAYALCGSVIFDFENQPLGEDKDGNAIFLRDIWPDQKEIEDEVSGFLTKDMFKRRYAEVYEGDDRWRAIEVKESELFSWDPKSTYIRKPSFFDGVTKNPEVKDIEIARVLVYLGDSVTTDHISPAGTIKIGSPAANYLVEHGVDPKDFNSYGTRRGNHEVMSRGTFANVRLKNKLVDPKEGGLTKCFINSEEMSIFDAAQLYKKENISLVVLAGKEYGSGSSRDWAAKGTYMLGIKAVIAESFERIHRSNLVEMGILPLQLMENETFSNLGITGSEIISIPVTRFFNEPENKIIEVKFDDKPVPVKVRIDTPAEISYYLAGGILNYVAKQLSGN
jgi:aconitate hydratase